MEQAAAQGTHRTANAQDHWADIRCYGRLSILPQEFVVGRP